MARLPLVREPDMTPEQRAQFARFPSNLTRGVLLAAPRLARALPEMANALRDAGLDAKLREGVILRVAHLCGSAYERMQHLGQARKAGWSDDEIARIESQGAAAFTGTTAAVLRFVDECVRDVRVGDATFADVRKRLPARDIATLLFLIGHVGGPLRRDPRHRARRPARRMVSRALTRAGAPCALDPFFNRPGRT